MRATFKMPKEPKRKDLSVFDKCEILKTFDALPPCSQRDAASKLGITQPTLNRLLRDKKKIEEASSRSDNLNRKRKRYGKDAMVETALLCWFNTAKKQNFLIRRGILMKKAASFASSLGHKNFTPTDGWLNRWKKRNNIVYKKQYGKKKDTDNASDEYLVKDILLDFF